MSDNKTIRLFISKDTQDIISEFNEITNHSLDIAELKKFIVVYGYKNYVRGAKNDNSISKKRLIEVRADSFTSNILDELIKQKEKIEDLTSGLKKQYYEEYIELGAKLINDKISRCKDKKAFVLQLVKDEINNINIDKKANRNEERTGSANVIKLTLGQNKYGELVEVIFNDVLNSGYHMGIVGTTGSGKSQLALNLSSQIKAQSPNTNIIFFDYAKGDIAANNKYTEDINAKVIDVINEGIPFNPFDVMNITDIKIEELKELVVSNQALIGPNQKLELYDIMKYTFEEHEVVNFNILYQEVKNFYKAKSKDYNVLVELFHKISILDIFRNEAGYDLIDSFMNCNLIFDLHNIESTMSIKEVVVFFILHKLYTEAIRLPDSTIDTLTGSREIRTVVVLDEGHNYLRAKNSILEKMLRELRSKGIAVIIITQAFSDFKTKDFDYSEMMNWIMVMKSQIEARNVQNALNITFEEAKKLQVSIPNLPPFTYYTRGIRNDRGDSLQITTDKYN